MTEAERANRLDALYDDFLPALPYHWYGTIWIPYSWDLDPALTETEPNITRGDQINVCEIE